MTRYIIVTGWSHYHRQMDKLEGIDPAAKGPRTYPTGYSVFWWEGDTKVNYAPDIDTPVTLKRCKQMLEYAEDKTGNVYSKITIEDTRFDDDHRAIYRKRWSYNKALNRLLIWEAEGRDITPVYENGDGNICSDRYALADCYLKCAFGKILWYRR